MPPKAKFTREEVVNAASAIVRAEGMDALSSRALGTKLGSSARPIFTVFQNMEEVRREVWSAANKLYLSYYQEDVASGKYPPYKAGGMAYIRFAKEEQELFKLLFMRNHSQYEVAIQNEHFQSIIDMLQKNYRLSKESAFRFHTEMWIFVHGLATVIATSYLDLDK